MTYGFKKNYELERIIINNSFLHLVNGLIILEKFNVKLLEIKMEQLRY